MTELPLYTLAFRDMYKYGLVVYSSNSPKSCILSDMHMATIPIRHSVIGKQYNQGPPVTSSGVPNLVPAIAGQMRSIAHALEA